MCHDFFSHCICFYSCLRREITKHFFKLIFITYKGEILLLREFVGQTHTELSMFSKTLFSYSIWELFLPCFYICSTLRLSFLCPCVGYLVKGIAGAVLGDGNPEVGCVYSVIPRGGEEVSRGKTLVSNRKLSQHVGRGQLAKSLAVSLV